MAAQPTLNPLKFQCCRAIVLTFLIAGLRTTCAADIIDIPGHGYTNYGGVYVSTNLRSRVLDLGALRTVGNYQIRERVDIILQDSLRRERHIRQGFDEFATTLKSKVSIGGSFASFKADVKGHYNSASSSRTDFYFSRLATVIDRAQLRVHSSSTATLRSFVLPQVRSFIETESPARVFAQYGTHVATGVVAGGMLELWSSSLKSKFSSERDYSVSVDASYKKLVKGSASLSVTERRNSERVSSHEGLIVHGGSLVTGADGESAWVSSTATNAQTIRFTPAGTVPVWELVTDATQRARLRKHYEFVFAARSIILKRFASAPIDRTPRVPHPQAQVYVPRGWKVVSGGADVKFYGVGQLLAKSYPILSGGKAVGWRAESKDHLESDPGRIQAFAIAMWDPEDAWDVHVSRQTSSVQQHPSGTARVPSGFTLVGGGVDVQYIEPGNMIVDTYPSSSTGWFASSKDHLRPARSRLVAYAIGVRHRSGSRLSTRTKRNRFGPVQHPNGRIYATEGYSFIGAGAAVSKGGVGNMLVRLVPGADGKQIYAYAKDHLEPDRRYLTVYGIEVFGATYVRDSAAVIGLDPAAF